VQLFHQDPASIYDQLFPHHGDHQHVVLVAGLLRAVDLPADGDATHINVIAQQGLVDDLLTFADESGEPDAAGGFVAIDDLPIAARLGGILLRGDLTGEAREPKGDVIDAVVAQLQEF